MFVTSFISFAPLRLQAGLTALLWGAKAPVVANNANFALSSQTLLIRNVPSESGGVFALAIQALPL